jgi:hypothetical protein
MLILFKIIFSLRSPRRLRGTFAQDRVGVQTLTLAITPAHGVRSIEAHDMDSSGLA